MKAHTQIIQEFLFHQNVNDHQHPLKKTQKGENMGSNFDLQRSCPKPCLFCIRGHYGQYGIVRHSGTRKFQNPQFS